MAVKNVIFDIGNVLTDFRWKEFLIERCGNEELAERIGRASVATKEWSNFDLGFMTREEITESFVKNDPEVAEIIRECFRDIKDLVTPRDYAIPWVKSLKERGFGVYYLSNYSYQAESDCPASLEFIKYTDGGILSCYYGVIKPDRRIYELLLEKYSLKAEECVFIDDTYANIEGAIAVGINGIHFTTKEEVDEKLKELGI